LVKRALKVVLSKKTSNDVLLGNHGTNYYYYLLLLLSLSSSSSSLSSVITSLRHHIYTAFRVQCFQQLISPARFHQCRTSIASTVSSFRRLRMSVTEPVLMHSTLREVADMTGWTVACFFQNFSGLLPAGGTLIAL